MPTITTYDYYTGEIMIPGIGVSDSAEQLALTEAIARYEPECLKKLLGVELYGLFWPAYLASIDEDNPVALDARYDYILNGHNYAISEVSYTWGGLKNTLKLSPLAYYVWYRYTSDPSYTGVGVVSPNSENASKINPAPKYCRVWNQMVDWNRDLHDMLEGLDVSDTSLYPEFESAKRYIAQGVGVNPNREGYELFKTINRFDI